MYSSKGGRGQCYLLDKSPPGPVDKVIGFSNTLADMLASYETKPRSYTPLGLYLGATKWFQPS